MKRSVLWERLVASGAAQGELPPDGSVPWPVRIMLGAGAWLASLAVLGFLAVLSADLLSHSASRLILAALAGVGAVQLSGHSGRRPFASQIGLVLACLMQLLLLVSAFDDLRQEHLVALAVVAIGALSLLVPTTLWRAWCTWVMLFGLAWLLRELQQPLALALLVGASAGAGAWLWLEPGRWVMQQALWRPLALGLSLGSLALCSWHPAAPWFVELWFETRSTLRPEVLAMACSALLAAVNAWLVLRLGRAVGARRAALAAALVVLLALATWSTPAISAALGLLLLGFGRAESVLLGVGIAGLLAGLSAHYYVLTWSLNLKALSLASAGIVLLGARVLLLRLPPEAGR